MSALDRLADRLMAALPRSRAGMIALTAIGGVLLAAGAVHWLGWWMTAAILLAGVAGAGAWWALSPWRCRL